MSRHRRHRRRAAALLATALVASLTAACSSDDDGDGGGDADKITVWIEEDLPDRVAATQAIVDAFTAETGIEVELTPVAEDQFNQILTSNAAAGDLPDVMGGIPLGQIRTLSSNELLDTDAVAEVLESLGSELDAHFTVSSDETIDSAELRELAEDAGGGEVPSSGEPGKIVARFDPESGVQEGQEAEIWVDAERLHLFDPEDGRNLTVEGRAPAATGGGDVSQGG